MAEKITIDPHDKMKEDVEKYFFYMFLFSLVGDRMNLNSTT